MLRIVALVVACAIVPTLSTAQSVFVGPEVWIKDLESGQADRFLRLRTLFGAPSLSSDGRHVIPNAPGLFSAIVVTPQLPSGCASSMLLVYRLDIP